jgi:hypothetical protein
MIARGVLISERECMCVMHDFIFFACVRTNKKEITIKKIKHLF